MMSASGPHWNQIFTFLSVMRHGSLSAAAREMGVAQPTVRNQIEHLESTLGFKLFTRAQNGLTPTPPAKVLLERALAIESSIGSFARLAQSSAFEVQGTVRVTCSEVFGTEILPEILAPLLTNHEGLEINLVPTDEVADLLRRDCDIAVRMMKPTQGALIAKRLKSVEIGLYAHPSYVRRHGLPKTYEEFCNKHLAILADSDRSFSDALKSRGLPEPKNSPLRTDSPTALISAIRAGIGIGPCQCRIASKYGLERILPDQSFMLDCWVAMHEDLREIKRVKIVFDHLASSL